MARDNYINNLIRNYGGGSNNPREVQLRLTFYMGKITKEEFESLIRKNKSNGK